MRDVKYKQKEEEEKGDTLKRRRWRKKTDGGGEEEEDVEEDVEWEDEKDAGRSYLLLSREEGQEEGKEEEEEEKRMRVLALRHVNRRQLARVDAILDEQTFLLSDWNAFLACHDMFLLFFLLSCFVCLSVCPSLSSFKIWP